MELLHAIRSWVKGHYVAIFFALLAGVLTVMPHLLAMHALGDTYQGVPFLFSDNEDYYLARIQEIADGHGFVGSPYFWEYKDKLPIVPSIGEYLYIAMSVLTHLSIPATLVFAKFLFPLLLFLLVYTFILNLSGQDISGKRNVWGAIAGACIVVLGADLLNYHFIYDRLVGNIADTRVLSQWARPVNPITGALFLFIYLYLLWRVLREKSWILPISAGVIITLSLGYTFTVGIELTLLGLLFILSLFWKEFELSKRLFVVGAVGSGLASLYWWKVWGAFSESADLAGKSGLMLMHTPLPNKVLIATLLVMALFIAIAYRYGKVHIFRARTSYLNLWFVMTLLASSFIVLNQQIVTGRTVWPYHFVQYTNPIAILSIFVFGFVLFRPYFPRVWKAVTVIGIAASVGLAIWNASTYIHSMDEFRALQQFAPVYHWINKNTVKDCVFLVADDDQEQLTGFLPGFTACNVYGTKNFVSAAVSNERLQHNFFVLLRLRGIDDAHIGAYLEAHQELVLRYFYKDYQELFGLIKNDRIEKLTPKIADAYQIFYKQDFATELSQYRIDYVLTKEALPAQTVKSLEKHIEPVFRSGAMTVYAFH